MTVPSDFYSTPAMTALFAPEEHVARMLGFEAALARAEARAGVIPADHAEGIAAVCRVELFDIEALYREAATAGTAAIPLVRMLTERVEGEAKRSVHWGATSQDAIDTALVLQMRDGLDLLIADLLALGGACAALAERHRRTPMAGRTIMQQALPITFGLKAARWLGLVTRGVERLRGARAEIAVLQFGGAAGTLASLGADGQRVADLLAAELGLALPDLPWHAERDRIGAVAATLGVVVGSLAKIATDVILLRQTEVGELTELPVAGKGGSSTLPQKQNPIDATFALAAARLAIGVVPIILGAMVQEHERAAGGWQTEWQAIPDLFRATAACTDRLGAALAGVVVDEARMRANLNVTSGAIMAESLTMALAPRLGRPAAYALVKTFVEQARSAGDHLRDVARADERVRACLSPEEIERALDPLDDLGAANHLIDRALDAFACLDAKTPSNLPSH